MSLEVHKLIRQLTQMEKTFFLSHSYRMRKLPNENVSIDIASVSGTQGKGVENNGSHRKEMVQCKTARK